MNPLLEINDLHITAGKFSLQKIEFTLSREDYAIILGPTGCGKTVLLESIAGHHAPYRGTIYMEGRNITRLPPEQRYIGLAYQDSLLYPFMTVLENILFGARARGMAGDPKVRRHMDQLVEIMGIAHILNRCPAHLSGGEKQRVSLARAILTYPPLLLLDEPLSALDPQTRCAMQSLLREIHRGEGLGIIHVTHDFSEAMQLGTHLTVLKNGLIEQTGSPLDVFFHPATQFVARFLQGENLLPGTLLHEGGQLWFRQSDGPLLFGPLTINKEAAPPNTLSGKIITMLIRAGDIRLNPGAKITATNSWTASVSQIYFNRTHVDICCEGNGTWQTSLSLAEWREFGISAGVTVNLSVRPENLHIITEKQLPL
jgi:molybdate transport system ATP-binding protein